MAAKKPDMGMILGIGKKKKPDEAPPDLPGAGGPPDDVEPDPGDPMEDAEMAAGEPPELGGAPPGAGGSDLTPDMLDYHDGTASCGNCTMFTAPSTCSRWPDPVEEAGWCKGFVPNAGGGPEMPPEAQQGLPGGPPA